MVVIVEFRSLQTFLTNPISNVKNVSNSFINVVCQSSQIPLRCLEIGIDIFEFCLYHNPLSVCFLTPSLSGTIHSFVKTVTMVRQKVLKCWQETGWMLFKLHCTIFNIETLKLPTELKLKQRHVSSLWKPFKDSLQNIGNQLDTVSLLLIAFTSQVHYVDECSRFGISGRVKTETWKSTVCRILSTNPGMNELLSKVNSVSDSVIVWVIVW